MAKKQSPNPIRKRSHEIDNIPKYSSQPRSLVPKRPRTDFSNLLGFSPSITHGTISFPIWNISDTGSWLVSSSDKDEYSKIPVIGVEDSKDKANQLPELPLVRCSKSGSKEFGVSSSSIEVPAIEAEPVSQDAISDPRRHRDVMEQKSDAAVMPEFIPKRSRVTESCSISLAPGSVVWAKTDCQMWWPAEAKTSTVMNNVVLDFARLIMNEGLTLADGGNKRIDGNVLVQFYGNLQRAWVDPATDISQLEECFKERSCNSSEDFQDALKQALQGKEHLSSCQLLGNHEGRDKSNQHNHSSAGRTSSISSGEVLATWKKKSAQKCNGTSLVTSKAVQQTRRGQRERKPKIHFDEAKRPLKSNSEPRRLRIMRHLGLAPPVGSPF